MRSIDTEYDGYRFRSRLEARWAIVWNELGIDYTYEPEGVRVPLRFRTTFYPRPTTINWLPDFFLPDLGLYCEVKGRMGPTDEMKTYNGAAALSEEGFDTLVLADVFRQPRGRSRRPWRLAFTSGELFATPWPKTKEPVVKIIASESDPQAIGNAIDLLRGYVSDEPLPKDVRAAFRAAQRARFEHGETP